MAKPLSSQEFFDGTWNIVDFHMKKDNGRQLVNHLIDSFNDFIMCKLEHIIEGFNPVDLHYQYMPEEDAFKYILSLEIKNPILSKPIIFEKDGSTKVMTPNDARSRNFTYASPVMVDLVVSARNYCPDTKQYTVETKKINNVLLGKIPIMVRSKYCILSTHGSEKECRYDPGGYFIVNGNEKAVICQDRIAENKTYVFTNNKVSAYSHMAEIRSLEENRFSVPKTTSMKLSSKSNQFGRYVRVTIHHVKHDIPLFILFKALGIETDKEIIQHIVYDLDDKVSQLLIKELAGSVDEASHIYSTNEAREYLLRYMNVSGYPKEFLQNKFYRLNILQSVLEDEFLPHVGKDLSKKALYIGYMMRKLLQCYLGLMPFDDRDSYLNKRIDTPGILMANLFRQYYGKMIKDMKNMVQKEINSGSWKATNKFINTINKVNITKIIKSTIIESGLKYGLATGNWGIKSNKTKQGVAQVLNRMTYNATLSHLRRINTPIEKTGKLVQPRKLHSTQWGIICPAETPEGGSVGLVKNMAFMSHVTTSSNSLNIYVIMKDQGVQHGTLLDYNKHTRVFVNGNMIGFHTEPYKLVDNLRRMKRRGEIHAMASITWDMFKREVYVCTDAGRCVRPLYIVRQGRIALTRDLIELVKKGKLSWMDLVIGNDQYGIEPVIEYLDVEECNGAMIAMRYEDLATKTDRMYTHLEMDPSLILGVLAGSIPFSNHNQAPRNSYQSAMGKQAVGIYTSNFLNRYDTMAHILNYPQLPLVQTRISKLINNNSLPCGMNVIVAISTYTGFNQEDSVIMNKSAVDRGMFHSTYYRTYKEQNNKNHSTGEEEYFCKPHADSTKSIKPYNYDKLGEGGFVKENTYIEAGDVIIGKCMPQKTGNIILNKDTSVFLKNNEKGFVDRNASHNQYFTNINGDGYTFSKVRIRSDRIPSIGDKFCLPATAEVLTTDGWIYINDVTSNHYVAQLNPIEQTVEYVRPCGVYKFFHNGEMYQAEGERVSILATMEHKMYVKKDSHKPYLVAAEDLLSTSPSDINFQKGAIRGLGTEYDVQRIVNIEDGLSIPIEDWITIYASWLRSFVFDVVDKTFTISPKDDLVQHLQIIWDDYSLGIYNEKGQFILTRPELFNYFNKQQYIPSLPLLFQYQLSVRESRMFLNALMDKKNTILCMPWLANAAQSIALHAGWCADIHPTSDRRQLVCISSVLEAQPEDHGIMQSPFKGFVYCIEVPSHIFYIRMNGCTMWTGNSSRHGQKGTVGMLYRQEDMPFTKEGIVPDIIINPHAIPSRMTIAQLMECIMGKCCTLLGTYGDATPFTELSVEDLAEILEANGVERYSNEVLYNSRTGEQISTIVFMGPTYYQRLKHMTDDKIHSRSANGPVVLITRQPAEGRARDGGLRLGEMEVECNWAHGTMQFLKERFMECSDNYRVFVCKKCGMISDVNPEKNLFKCKPCKNTSHFAEVRIPYACKLMFQEIQTMSIAAKFITG